MIAGIDISDLQDEATRWYDNSDVVACKNYKNLKINEKNFPSIVDYKYKNSNNLNSKWDLKNFIISNFKFTIVFYRILKSIFITDEKKYLNVFKTERASFTFQNWSELNNKNFPDGYAPLGVQTGLQKLDKKISELIKYVKQQNSKIYLLIYPWPGQLYFGSEEFSWEEFITKACKKNECDGVINLFPEFVMEKKLYKDWYFKLFLPGDIHFNKYGNKIVAKKIFETVIKNID